MTSIRVARLLPAVHSKHFIAEVLRRELVDHSSDALDTNRDRSTLTRSWQMTLHRNDRESPEQVDCPPQELGRRALPAGRA